MLRGNKQSATAGFGGRGDGCFTVLNKAIREASLRGILEAGLGGGKRVIRGEQELPEKREQPAWWV